MPKRTDLTTILIIGSGPIVIGQGCEFDYSGTQACKTLKSEGFRIVLVNSNPATIMTDPGLSDRTYIEPITPEAVEKIIIKQKEMGDPIHAVLPTLGGQTALNCACALWDKGILQKHDIEMIGANREIIHRAEDRQIFKDICEGLGLKVPRAKTVTTLADAEEFLKEIGLPAIIRPAFTLGGTGGGIAYNKDEFVDIITRGLRASMIGQVQIDQSVIGWKEYELEVVRDKKDNCIIVCGIENIDPMGVHTGDSITVAPIQTLSDKEYQAMRDAAIAIMRAVGVETGGSNVQFAVNPDPKPNADGSKPFEMVVVEMNPRVSRSSALASKATGFPIAKVAARLAVGYTLDELRNEITGTTSACFEPAIDYVVTKIPRWTFEKFPEADETLTTQMKSVGEAMAIGRTFKESFQKVIRSMDVKRFGYGLDRNDKWLLAKNIAEGKVTIPAGQQARTADGEALQWPLPEDKLSRKLSVPSQGRLFYIRYAFKLGWSIDKVFSYTKIDRWFLDQLQQIVEFEDRLLAYKSLGEIPRDVLATAKRMGFSDAQLANVFLGNITPENVLKVRAHRKSLGINPVYKLVDTCAAEFAAVTPYYYSTYEESFTDASGKVVTDDEVRITDKKKVLIIGGGPNRIGQGIEFDYCCCHAAFAAKQLGLESVMINSNPETVSTDYDTSDLLFFEPLTLEDVVNIAERLNGSSLVSPNSISAPGREISDQDRSLLLSKLRERGYDRGLIVDMIMFNPAGHAWVVQTTDGKVWQLALNTPAGSNALISMTEDFPEMAAKAHKPASVMGCIVQFGGQTPLNLAKGLAMAGVPIIGTTVDSIDLAEDRDRFDAMLGKLNLQKPPSGIARNIDQSVEIAKRIGYPVLVRPSYVLGGRGMEICSDERALRSYMTSGLVASDLESAPVLIDRFLSDATEVDVDVVADFGLAQNSGSAQAIVAGVMEHIEEAGIHSGDSACALPPYSLSPAMVQRISVIARELATELKICGLMNAQLAIKDDQIYILEVNPRASRTVPFVAKATHVPWARIAAKVMMGRTLAAQNIHEVTKHAGFSVKEVVFPFSKFPGSDIVLGPEMRSTGEVMGADKSFEIAFAKSQLACGVSLPTTGSVFISVRNADKPKIHTLARQLQASGLTIYCSAGTGEHLTKGGVPCTTLPKIDSGLRPNVLDLMADGKIHLVLNTPTRTGWQTDEGRIRAAAIRYGVPIITTTTGAAATARAIAALKATTWTVAALQDYQAELGADHPMHTMKG